MLSFDSEADPKIMIIVKRGEHCPSTAQNCDSVEVRSRSKVDVIAATTANAVKCDRLKNDRAARARILDCTWQN